MFMHHMPFSIQLHHMPVLHFSSALCSPVQILGSKLLINGSCHTCTYVHFSMSVADGVGKALMGYSSSHLTAQVLHGL